MSPRIALPIAAATLLAAAAAALASAAPGFTAASGLATTGEADVSSITALADGASLVGGYFLGTATIGDTVLASAGSWDGFVAQRNADGSYAWAQRFGGAGGDGVTDTDVAPDGSLLVLGSRDQGQRTTSFVTKLTAAGTVVWSRDIWAPGDGSSSHDAVGTGVVATADGGAAIVGRSLVDASGGYAVNFGSLTGPAISHQITGSNVKGWVTRLDGTGAFQWATPITSSLSPRFSSIVQLSDGSLAFGGQISGPAQFGAVSVTTAGGGSLTGFIARAALADGTVAVVSPIASNQSSDVVTLSAAPGGRILAGGTITGTTLFPGATTLTRTSQNGFVALQSADGTFEWSNAADGPGAFVDGSALRPDGTVIISGQSCGVTAFGTASITSRSDECDGFVAGVSATGEFRWAVSGGTSPHGATDINAVAARADGAAVSGGSIDSGSGNAVFGTATVTGNPFRTGVVVSVLDVPVTPAAPTARAGTESATASITPVPGSAITGYEVTASPGGRTCSIAASGTECAVTGLAAGTAYTLAVTARNAAGSSPASAASAAVTPTAQGGGGSTPVPRLGGTTRCKATTCTTTGTLPAGTTRVTQTATTRKAGTSLQREDANATVKGRCTLSPAKVKGRKVKKRTYTCTIRLRKGTWRITTTGFKGKARVAVTNRSVTVKARAAR